MSATWLTVVGSLVESLLVTTSPPPDTEAELVTELEAVADTFTVSVIAGYGEPAAKASERVQVNVASVHDQPVPEIAVAVRPLGSVSATVTVPLDAPVPELVAVSV